MKKLIGFFVIVFFVPSLALSQGKHPFTGSYDYAGGGETGGIDVLQLSDSMIKYEIIVVTDCCGHNIAECEGIVALNGNEVFTYSGDGQSGCPLHFHFEKNKVTITEGRGDCGWGMNATTNGIYVKNKSDPDFSTEGEVGSVYTITSSRAYFFADSSLRQQKKSYLIEDDKIHERASSENAIYAEIYNKKRLTMTYGWIAKKDLMQVPDK